jgi:LysM repeat protein
MRQGWVVTILLSVVLMLAACQQAEDTAPTATAGTAEAPPSVDGGELSGYPPPGGEGVSGDLSGYPVPGGDQPQIDAYPSPGGGEQTTPEAPSEPGTTAPGEPAAPTEPTIVVADVTAVPLPDAEVIAPPQEAGSFAPGSTVQHTVARGDWLLQVARCYGTSYTAVRDANTLPFPDYIVPGDVLTVPGVGSVGPIIGPPCVVEYTVQPGDTWEGLAARTGTTAAVLQRANPGPLTAGRVIFLPATSPAAAVLPALTHHLVFNLGGDLAVWRSTDSLVEVTADAPQVLDMATNGAGQYVLVRQTRDEGLSEEIALIDTRARTMTTVESGLPPQPADWPGSSASRLHVSPDGTWAVYLVETVGAYRLNSLQTSAPGTRYGGPEVAIEDTVTPMAIALSDGSNGTTFIVSDRSGLSEYPYSLDREARRILPLTGTPTDPVVGFFNVTPTPEGLYLLAQGGFMEGSAWFVIDAQTGAYGVLPDSGAYVTSGATFAATGSEFVVIEPTRQGALGPRWVTYQAATAGDTVTLTPLQDAVTPTLSEGATTEPMPGYVMSALHSQGSGRPYTVSITGSPAEQGVWRAAGSGAPLEKLNDMPTGPMTGLWVPDVSGVLVMTWQTDLGTAGDTYVSATGVPLFSLSDWLGGPISDPYWVRQ